MKKKHLNELLAAMRQLSIEDQQSVVNSLMDMMRANQMRAEEPRCDILVRSCVSTSDKPDCPHCSAKASLGLIIKKGRKGNGAQRFYCKSCKHYFVPTTNTAFEGTHKSAAVWEKFIRMTLSGASIEACALGCDIAHQTAFTWRHKILNAFAVNQEATEMAGTVELDEMLIPISYKGNHVQGGFGTRRLHEGRENDMPRKSYKRGSDNKSKSSRDKACIFCMVEDGNKAFYAAVPGVGFMSNDMLRCTMGKHVKKESAFMLADNYKVTRKYLEDNGYRHRILSSNTSDTPHNHKPEIVDGLHMQHVNNMHHHIRRFLAGYCGVSSKYLSNYVSLYVWLRNIQATKRRKKAEKVSVARASTPDCYITHRQLQSRPAVPQCA